MQLGAVLVLSDHVPDAAQGSPCILVDGGPYVRSSWFTLTGSAFHDHHDPFAVGRGLHSHCLAVNQPVVAEGVTGFQISGFGAVCLFPFIGNLEQFRTTIHCRCADVAAPPLLWRTETERVWGNFLELTLSCFSQPLTLG